MKLLEENESLDITESVLKRFIYVYIIIFIVILSSNILKLSFQCILLIFVSTVNTIVTFSTINYYSINLNKIVINLMKINLSLMIVYYFYLISIVSSINAKSNSFMTVFFMNIMFTGLFMNLSCNFNENNFNEKRLILKDIFFIVTGFAILCLYTNSVITINKYLLIICALNVVLIVNSWINIFRKKQSKSKVLITLLMYITILDLIITILMMTKINIEYVALLRYSIVNLYMALFSYSIAQVTLKNQFRELNDLTESLIEINNTISIKNALLEINKNKIIKENKIYTEFLKIVDVPLTIIDSESKRIRYANNKFLELVKIDTFKEVIGRKIEKIINLDNSASIDIIEGHNKERVFYLEIEGEQKVLNINLVDLSEKEVFIIFNDISNKKNIDKLKLEIESKKNNETMKKLFLSNITHDLKTPIGVIYSSSQLQKIYIDKKQIDKIKKYNNVNLENCVYLNRLTNNIMDVSMITEKNLKPTFIIDNIVSFIEEKVNFINNASKINKTSIIFDTEYEEIYVKFDEGFMERILLNLLSNAIKFSGDSIEVHVNIRTDKGHAYIEVIDFGVGISSEFKKRIFEIYASDKIGYANNHIDKSSGIGLFVVYNLLKLQNATIWVDSEEGQGSKFTICFLREEFYG